MRRRVVALLSVAIVILAVVSLIAVATSSNKSTSAETPGSGNITQSTDSQSTPLVKPDLTITCTSSRQMLVGTRALGVVASCGDDEANSTASLAKVLTALVVLNALESDAQLDETITVDAQDMEYLAQSNEEGGTSIQVFEGETFSKRLALEGMILASANNLANTLARAQFGSLEAYHDKAVEYIARRGLGDAQVGGDASGLDNGTRMRPTQLFALGKLALENDTLAKVVSLPSIEFPTVFSGGESTETITNGNPLLEVGFDGIKIGYTDEAGRCIIFSRALPEINDTIIGMTLGDGNDANGFSFIDAQNISYQLELALTTP